jgi:hypothetical protein
MKELEEVSNKKLIQTLIAERKSSINVYAPLYKRLVKKKINAFWALITIGSCT